VWLNSTTKKKKKNTLFYREIEKRVGTVRKKRARFCEVETTKPEVEREEVEWLGGLPLGVGWIESQWHCWAKRVQKPRGGGQKKGGLPQWCRGASPIGTGRGKKRGGGEKTEVEGNVTKRENVLDL